MSEGIGNLVNLKELNLSGDWGNPMKLESLPESMLSNLVFILIC